MKWCKRLGGLAMNAAQRILVERTLEFIGYVLLVFVILMFLTGVANEGPRFFRETFDSKRMIILVWPTLITAAACLWFRAFLQAGKK